MPEIPQRILVLRDFCIRTRNADCTRCADACPHHALSFAPGQPPAVDQTNCTLCGMCEGTCDAFATTRNTLAELHAAARRAAMGSRPCVITCEEAINSFSQPASNVVALPCLAAFPAELWCALLSEGFDVQVCIDFTRCESCQKAGPQAESLYSANIAQAESWTGRAIGFTERIPEASEEGLFAGLINAGANGDRRSLFSDVFSQLKDAASGSLRERTDDKLRTLREQNQRLNAHQRLNLGNGTQFNAFAPHGRTRQIMGLSRKLLLQAIDAQPSIAQTATLPLPATSEACEQCLACTRACPTGARLPDAQDGTLTFDWRYCTGCGLCEQACPNDAITLTTQTIEQATC